MTYKSKKAIKALKRHLVDLNGITNSLQGNTWKASLNDTLTLYLGPDSVMIKRLNTLYFTRTESIEANGYIGPINHKVHIYDDSNKVNFSELVENAIKLIESNGIYVDNTKKNFLSGYANMQILGGLFTFSVTIFGIGFYFGGQQKDREIISYELKLNDTKKELQDSFKENEILKNHNKINFKDSTIKSN